MALRRSIGVLGAAVALVACAPSRRVAKPAPAPAAAAPVTYVDPDANMLPYYGDISADEVVTLEGLVARGSINCVDHAKLAAYYGRDFSADDDTARRRVERLMWLAEHCPTKGQQYLFVSIETAVPPQLLARWEDQMEAHPDSAEVVGNLAALLEMERPDRALELYERAEKLDPRNPRWPEQQANILARGHFTRVDSKVYATSYEKLARAAELTPDADRFDYEGELAEAALRSGETATAKAHAERILALIGSEPKNWNTGNLIYSAHVTLGRIALQKGDVAGAKRHLLEAAKTPGSPQLNSFGPDMTLAQELLDEGERDVVLEYLELVGRFWAMDEGDLVRWRDEIRRGQRPMLRDH